MGGITPTCGTFTGDISPVTVTDVRTLLKNVVEAHATHNTFYSIWSVAKDRASELEYPCVIWDQWRSRLVDDPQGYLHRSVLIRLLIITSVPTDRTPLERDQAVEAADNAASDIVLKIREDYRDLELSNISTTTMFDEYSQLETGVLLTFTLMGEGLCLDQDQFPGTNCPTFAELISALSWSEIKADMSEQQIADATADLGGGSSEPTTVNGTQITGQTVTVTRGGEQVGTVNVATGEVVVEECEPCPPCEPVIIRTTDGNTPIASVASGDTYDLPSVKFTYENAAGVETDSPSAPTGFDGDDLVFPGVVPRRQLTLGGQATGLYATLDGLAFNTIPDVPLPQDATVQLKDSSGTNIGSPVGVPSGTSANITAPDGTVTVRNLNGTALGSPSVKSNGTANYTAPIPMKMGWGAGDADTLAWTVTDAEAGTYNSYTQDGGSGTITYSKNGAAFAALSGTITLAVGNTIKVRRTTTTNAGYSTWAP